jgi:hypothetical protein
MSQRPEGGTNPAFHRSGDRLLTLIPLTIMPAYRNDRRSYGSRGNESSGCLATTVAPSGRHRDRNRRARLHSSEPAVNSQSPIWKMRLRPKRSEVEPASIRRLATTSVYASSTHCSPERFARRSRWIAGRATLTMVTSMPTSSKLMQHIDRIKCWWLDALRGLDTINAPLCDDLLVDVVVFDHATPGNRHKKTIGSLRMDQARRGCGGADEHEEGGG